MATSWEEELKRRMLHAKNMGWSQAEIDRSATIERAMRNKQQTAQRVQQAQTKADNSQRKEPSGWKKFLVNAGALAGQTAAGVAGLAFAPVTMGGSLAGAFGAGAGIEALRRKALGEQASVSASLLEGGLTTLPVAGGIFKAGKAAKIANMADTANDATKRKAELVPKMASTKTQQPTQDLGQPFTVQNAFEASNKGAKNFDVGITPFRGTPGKSIVDTNPYYETPRAKQFVSSIQSRASESGINVAQLNKSAGFWEGSMEPSFNVLVKAPASRVRSWAAEQGQKYNQDGVILFTGAKNGSGARYSYTVKDPQKAADLLTKNGISGATIAGNEVKVFDFGGELADNIQRYNKALGVKPVITKGRVELLEKESYGQYIQPIRSGAGGRNGSDLLGRTPTATGTTAPTGSVDELLDSVEPATGSTGVFGDFKNMFRPSDEGMMGAPGRAIERGGDSLRATGRGVIPGMRPANSPGEIRPAKADEINKFLNDNKVKGSVNKQLRTSEVKQQQVYKQIDSELEKINAPLPVEQLASIKQRVNSAVAGENGSGVIGMTKTHRDIVEELGGKIDTIRDYKGLEKLRRTIDSRINFARNPNTPDPVAEDVYKAFRFEIDKIVSEASPALKSAKTMNAKLETAMDALVKNSPATLKQSGNTGFVGKVLNNSPTQAFMSGTGRTLQGTGRVLSSPAAQQFAQQAGLRWLANPLKDQIDGEPPKQFMLTYQEDGNIQLTDQEGNVLEDLGNANNLAGLDESNPDAEALNLLLGEGYDSFEDLSQGLSQYDQIQATGIDPATMGAEEAPANPFGTTSADLTAQAIAAFQAGDTKSSDQLLQLAASVADWEETQAQQAKDLKKGEKGSEADAKMTAAKTIVDNLMNVYEQVGGPKGIYSGTASNVLGFANIGEGNETARAYEQNRQSYLTPIIKAFGEVGVLTDKDREVISKAIPSITDTPAQAEQKRTLLYQMIESLAGTQSDPSEEFFNQFAQMFASNGSTNRSERYY